MPKCDPQAQAFRLVLKMADAERPVRRAEAEAWVDASPRQVKSRLGLLSRAGLVTPTVDGWRLTFAGRHAANRLRGGGW